MKKRILAAIITAVMVIVMIPFTAFAEVTIPTFDAAIGNITELNNLFTNGGSGYLTADIEATDYLTIKGDKTVDLDLKGYTIDLNKKNITLGYSSETGTLNLYDTVGTGTISNGAGTTGGEGGAVYIYNGNFTMYGGTIKDCTVTSGGGAVNVWEGTFTMNDGSTIKNCNAIGTGLYGDGGAVFVDGAQFIMKGGTIEDCTAKVRGGAVLLNNEGTFDMYKGSTIQKCKAMQGGAVYVLYGSFHMFGGLLSDNEAELMGGAVYNEASAHSFHMHGGEISGNTAVSYAGGVFNSGDCSFDGYCIVKDNYSYQGDAGKTADKKTRDNVFIYGNALFEIGNDRGEESLKEGSEIWVNIYGRAAGYITSSHDQDVSQYFKSDADAYYAEYDKDSKKVELVSRIIQQPDADNHYTVKVNTDGLGYTDPEFQWNIITPTLTTKQLKDLDKRLLYLVLGQVNFSSNAIKMSELQKSVYATNLWTFFGIDKMTFKSSTEAWVSSDTIQKVKDHFEYTSSGPEVLLYTSPNEGTLSEVTFFSYEDTFDDHDETLNGGTKDSSYFCRIFYKDGSVDDSSDVTVVAHGDHKWSYSLSKKDSDNDTIKAVCDEKGECDYKGTDTSLTISAEDASLDGKAHGAALSGKTLAGVAEKDFPVIQYEKEISENKYDKATTEAPKETGKYRASITVGEGETAVTAYVKYEIKEAITPAVTADFASFWVYLMIAGLALASIGFAALKLTKKSGR